MATKQKVAPKRTDRRASPREIPQARDALPVGAILLNQAYELVLDAILENPNALPEFDEDWSEALEASKKYEEQHQDPSEFDAELAAFWHEKKRANLFFRLCLDERQLAACVLDPRTGTPRELIPPGWVSEKWDTYIPSGIWDEYIDNENYDSPGPTGSVIDGAVRRVFFDKDMFNTWLVKRFPNAAKLDARTSQAPTPFGGLSRKPKIFAATFALHKYMAKGNTLIGLNQKQLLRQLDGICEEYKIPKVSRKSLSRALKLQVSNSERSK